MRVILEGPDNAGKTTLAEKIVGSVKNGVHYFHPGGRPTDFEHEVACVTEQLKCLSTHSKVVMDRVTPISQQVYNPDPALDPVRRDMLRQYTEMDVLFIYCKPSVDRLLRTQDLTWREGESEDHKQKIITRQHEFVKRYDEVIQQVKFICYDFEDQRMSGVIVNQLAAAMAGSTEAVDWFRRLINYR